MTRLFKLDCESVGLGKVLAWLVEFCGFPVFFLRNLRFFTQFVDVVPAVGVPTAFESFWCELVICWTVIRVSKWNVMIRFATGTLFLY